MSDLKKKPTPNYAPTYAAAMYPELAEIARSHGYALAVHGSLARDLDLIAIPWIEEAGEPQAVLDDILKKFAVNLIGEVSKKPHGRTAYTLNVGWGHCAIDLQFIPKNGNNANQHQSPMAPEPNPHRPSSNKEDPPETHKRSEGPQPRNTGTDQNTT